MTEQRISSKETAGLKHTSDPTLIVDTTLGLLLPGLALILAPGVLLAGSNPAITAAMLITALFGLSVHLGLQDSPAYGRLAPLLLAPLALGSILAIGLAPMLPMPISLLVLLPAVVFARAVRHAWRHTRRASVTVG
ncbi:MAG: hypothetical protein ACI8RZ_004446 [Myxococcota bacterium]|jgi:hypothetical protein